MFQHCFLTEAIYTIWFVISDDFNKQRLTSSCVCYLYVWLHVVNGSLNRRYLWNQSNQPWKHYFYWIQLYLSKSKLIFWASPKDAPPSFNNWADFIDSFKLFFRYFEIFYKPKKAPSWFLPFESIFLKLLGILSTILVSFWGF